MQLTIHVRLDVDPAKWAAEYGLSAGETPADVESYWDADTLQEVLIPAHLRGIVTMTASSAVAG